MHGKIHTLAHTSFVSIFIYSYTGTYQFCLDIYIFSKLYLALRFFPDEFYHGQDQLLARKNSYTGTYQFCLDIYIFIHWHIPVLPRYLYIYKTLLGIAIFSRRILSWSESTTCTEKFIHWHIPDIGSYVLIDLRSIFVIHHHYITNKEQ